jgi:hypothetical protein
MRIDWSSELNSPMPNKTTHAKTKLSESERWGAPGGASRLSGSGGGGRRAGQQLDGEGDGGVSEGSAASDRGW